VQRLPHERRCKNRQKQQCHAEHSPRRATVPCRVLFLHHAAKV
jgi:hypothetical protein